MSDTIVVEELVKRYRGAELNAVDGISFRVGAGQFFTLLGPNGAGKTTTTSIHTGRPSGSCRASTATECATSPRSSGSNATSSSRCTRSRAANLSLMAGLFVVFMASGTVLFVRAERNR